jgi:hypothetical protein
MYVFQEAYFVCTLLRSGRVYFDQSKIVDFPTSTMGRHLLAVSAHCGQVQIRLDPVPVILSVSRIRICFYFQLMDLRFQRTKMAPKSSFSCNLKKNSSLQNSGFSFLYLYCGSYDSRGSLLHFLESVQLSKL